MQAVKFAEKIVTNTARKPKAAPGAFKTSALESARRFGIVGAYSGPPDLAAHRKRYARASHMVLTYERS